MADRVLHVTNGDSAAAGLRKTGNPGTVAVWADVLHEGPVPPDDDLEAWLETRAQFIAGAGWSSHERALALQREWHGVLAGFAGYDEVVFWFEHDLFDQLLLIRHLAWLDRQPRVDTRVRLICIGAYPGIARFIGLGQLTPPQLAPLFKTRRDVSPAQFELAGRAWRAFTAADPRSLEEVLRQGTAPLPFLGAALGRFLEEYPDRDTGLPRTERQVLESLLAGPSTPGEMFQSCAQREEAPFMGDTVLWDRMAALAAGSNPLIRLSGSPGPGRPPWQEARITEAGQSVLAGNADWATLFRLDRWLGGVHLDTRAPHWRWHGAERRLVMSRG